MTEQSSPPPEYDSTWQEQVQLLQNLYARYFRLDTPTSQVITRVVDAAYKGGTGADFLFQVSQSMVRYPLQDRMAHAKRMVQFYLDIFTPEPQKPYYERVFESLIVLTTSDMIQPELSHLAEKGHEGRLFPVTYAHLNLLHLSSQTMLWLQAIPEIKKLIKKGLSQHESSSPTFHGLTRELKLISDRYHPRQDSRGMVLVTSEDLMYLRQNLECLRQLVMNQTDIDAEKLKQLGMSLVG